MSTINLSFISVFRNNGQEWPLLPGLLAQNPPKKTARGREQDRLIIYLTLGGNSSFTSSEYTDIISQLSQTFYNAPGSLTNALKITVEYLNNFLSDRNMRSTGKGLYSLGALVICSLRADQMYIVQAGDVHVIHFSKEYRHNYDLQLSGKGLGLGQNTRMYFSRVEISQMDRLLFCTDLPDSWEKSFTETRGSTSLEITRRRLLAIADGNVNGVLIQAAEGTGEMLILNPVRDGQMESPDQVVPGIVKIPEIQPETMPSLEGLFTKKDNPAPVETDNDGDSSQGTNLDSDAADSVAKDVNPVVDGESEPIHDPGIASENIREKRSKPQLQLPEFQFDFKEKARLTAVFLLRVLRSSRMVISKVSAWSEKAFIKLLPETEMETENNHHSISRSVSIFFAIALPVIVLFSARSVYFSIGYQAQYDAFLNRAQASAQQALSETTPTALRIDWHTTLDLLDQADQFKPESEPVGQALRLQAQSALDSLDKVVRIQYLPAFNTNLSKTLQVSRMAASDTDVYLLNSSDGSVIRGFNNTRNYDLDTTFQCGPGTYNDGITIEHLVDITVLVRNSASDASLMALDNSGKVLYCSPGKVPFAAVLPPPGTGWKKITAMSFDSSTLYILDAEAHAVWVYSEVDVRKFSEPQFFFGTQVPVMLEQAIGISANGDDLYLLHQDGHMTICTSTQVNSSTTRCSDPAIYNDTRPGYQGGIKLNDGIFSQIYFTGPPDPSIALLEPFTQSIFRFSPRSLELQNLVRAAAGKDDPLPKDKPIMAMAFSPNKVLFIFVNGQVYFSVNTP